MSVFVDTGVVVAYMNTKDRRNDSAHKALKEVREGRFGRPFVSDYVVDEAITFIRARTRSHPLAMGMAHWLLGEGKQPKFFHVLMMNGPTFREALRVFMTYQDQTLSFTDASSIAFVKRRGIDQILSYDRGFDGIVGRVDPTSL